MKKMTEEWLKASSDDLTVMGKILDDENLTHMVAFHAQQCVEKSLKAVIEEYEIDIPKIHSLVTLFSKVEHSLAIDFDQDLLQILDSLYINARYPGELGLLPNGKPSSSDAQSFYEFAKDVRMNIERKLAS